MRFHQVTVQRNQLGAAGLGALELGALELAVWELGVRAALTRRAARISPDTTVAGDWERSLGALRCGGRMLYREHKGVTYEVHYPERNQKVWGFGSAKLGEAAVVRFGERMAANEVWSRYRTLCAEGEPFDVALEYRGEHVDPSVILALGRLVSGECERFALWVPAREQLKVASG